jgi:hypothetical protein
MIFSSIRGSSCPAKLKGKENGAILWIYARDVSLTVGISFAEKAKSARLVKENVFPYFRSACTGS